MIGKKMTLYQEVCIIIIKVYVSQKSRKAVQILQPFEKHWSQVVFLISTFE
jgi:hypothetical protein